MIETGTVVEKPTHYLVSQYRYPDGDQARYEDTASRYLADLFIECESQVNRGESDIAAMNEMHKRRFENELEVLTAAADPMSAP